MSKYICECCNYTTNIKQNYDKHDVSIKHLKNKEQKKTIKEVKEEYIYSCINCTKKYKSNVGLWKHKKTCIVKKSQPSEIPSKEAINIFFENNKEYLIDMMINELKNSSLATNHIIPFNNKHKDEIVLFNLNQNNLKNEVIHIKEHKDELVLFNLNQNNLKNEVIHIKEELKKTNEMTNRRIDHLERKFMEFTDNYCMNNIDYSVFIDELVITYKFCKNFSEDMVSSITDLVKPALKKIGLENSPIYYVFDTNEKIIVRVKSEIWKTYYYDEMKTPGLIEEIINPLIKKIREALDSLSDNKLTRKNAYQQFYKNLENPKYKKDILDRGLYEPVFLDSKTIKRIKNNKENKKSCEVDSCEVDNYEDNNCENDDSEDNNCQNDDSK
jgi:hypothetical protein